MPIYVLFYSLLDSFMFYLYTSVYSISPLYRILQTPIGTYDCVREKIPGHHFFVLLSMNLQRFINWIRVWKILQNGEKDKTKGGVFR